MLPEKVASKKGMSIDSRGTRSPRASGSTLHRPSTLGAPINNQSDPFTFSNTPKITSLSQISITLRLRGENNNFNSNDLTLALDGIDTGIRLSGFDTNGQTLTFTGSPGNAAQILAALKQDGQLQATIVDSDSNRVSIPTNTNTTLVIQGKVQKQNKKHKR